VRSSVIARRYAKALILIGKEDGKSEKYREELSDFVGLLDNEIRLESAICNPLYTAKNRRNVLQAVLDKSDLSHAMKSFLMLLFDKGRITFLRDISDNYNKLADELKDFVKQRIEPYKYPREIVFVDGKSLPRTVTGKIQRFLLREEKKDG